MVAGHDIGGGVAQLLMLANKVEAPRVAVKLTAVPLDDQRKCTLMTEPSESYETLVGLRAQE